jgi:hypothetical protein
MTHIYTYIHTRTYAHYFNIQQDRQGTCNVLLRHVRVTIVAVEKQ